MFLAWKCIVLALWPKLGSFSSREDFLLLLLVASRFTLVPLRVLVDCGVTGSASLLCWWPKVSFSTEVCYWHLPSGPSCLFVTVQPQGYVIWGEAGGYCRPHVRSGILQGMFLMQHMFLFKDRIPQSTESAITPDVEISCILLVFLFLQYLPIADVLYIYCLSLPPRM